MRSYGDKQLSSQRGCDIPVTYFRDKPLFYTAVFYNQYTFCTIDFLINNQFSCDRGMAYTESIEKFILKHFWNKS